MMDISFTGRQFSLLVGKSFKIIGLVNGDRNVGLGMMEQFSNVHNYHDCLKALGNFPLLIMISTADA